IVYNSSTNKTIIFDMRVFTKEMEEPYYLFPNHEYDLSIYIPSILDKANNEKDIWELALGQLKNVWRNEEKLDLQFDDGEIAITSDSLSVSQDNLSVPSI